MNFLESKIYILNGSYDLSLDEEKINLNEVGESEVIAETIYSCISPGTELAAYKGLPPLRPGKQYPRLMGYCNISRVLKIGNRINQVEIGDSILTFASHRSIIKCSQDEIITVIKNATDLKKASTVYLFHLGYMALLESGAKPGMKVGIVGSGTLGFCTAMLSNQFGFNTSVFSDQSYLKTELDAEGIFLYGKSLNNIKQLISSFDVIINTSNSWDDWFLSMELLRKKGTMVNLGFPGRGVENPLMNPLDSQYFYDKQLTIKAAGYVFDGDVEPYDIRFTLKNNIDFLLNLIDNNRINPEKIISKEFVWSDLKELYDFLLDRSERKFTGILNWKNKNV